MEEEQYPDLDSYLVHHNTFEASQCICQDYRLQLLTLDDKKYYEEVDRAYYTYGTPAAQDYWLANQAPGPHRTMQELMQIFGKGRGQTHREELHGHRPFGSRMRSLQSRIQWKIKKNQRLRQRDQQARERLRQKAKIKSCAYIQLGEKALQTVH